MKTKHTHSARIGAFAISFALLFTMLPTVSAAADELTGSGATGKPAATIVSEVTATLNANIDAVATAATSFFNVNDGIDFVSGDLVLVGNEVVTLTTINAVTDENIDVMARGTTLNSVATTAEAHRSGDTVRNIDQNIQIVFESGSHIIQSGEKIVITVPADFDNFENLAAANVSASTESTGTVNATETFTTAAQTITITATGDFADANEAVTIVIGSTSQLDMPAKPGNYAFHIAIKNVNDEVLETGYALLSWANQVRVRAVVAEALILTIDDTTVNLNVDPSVDDGEDFSQKTILTAKTNARTGYKIQAKLAGAENLSSAQLDGTDTGNTSAITGGNAETTENLIGYLAYNSEETSKTKAVLKSEGTPVAFAAATAANLTLYDGTANGVEATAPTNSQKHTIYYALNVDYLTPAGTYEGTITYVALPTF
ncbi:MAG: hypothetical protein ABIE14_04050 [Patescibacteria group bacterium]